MRINKLIAIFCILFSLCSIEVSAQLTRIQGRVVDSDEQPLMGVNIMNPENDQCIGITDEDGRFNILAERSKELVFVSIGFEPKEIRIGKKQIYNITLKDAVTELDEVAIVAKARPRITPEPTDIEIKGNYFHLKTRIPVHKKLFTKHRRLVIQPSIYDITAKQRMLLKPVVFDGSSYNTTQNRMYERHTDKDPLAEYVQVKSTPYSQNDLITYHDSLYVKYLKHDFRADVHLAVENYAYILRRDSFSIARGTVNPLRFLEYNFSALPLTDDRFLPKPVMQLRDTKGEVNLTFIVGKADLDDRNPQNQIELDNLNEELHAIEQNPDANLKSFHIVGISSPDGGYEQNLRLSKLRTSKALERILSRFPASTREALQVTSDAQVASWKEVIAQMKADSLNAEAQSMEELIAKYGERSNMLGNQLRRQPYYKEVSSKYLPRLRKVQYTYGYSIFRTLTDDEIKVLYKNSPKELTRYEFYRLIKMTDDETLREKYCTEAVALYNNFMYASNELAVINIKRNTPKAELLERYISASTPAEVLSNHVIALLSEDQYSTADSVLNLVPDATINPQLRAVSQVKAGYYEEGYETIIASSPFNEVVMLLAMKRNAEAWEKAEKLNTGSAREHYLKAIAANRVDKVNIAMQHIKQAFELDPDLIEIAKVDGDIIDILPPEMQQIPNNPNKEE